MVRASLVLVLLGGCFDPDYPVGVLCGPPPESFCPGGQVCGGDGRCHLLGEADARPDDARTADAPTTADRPAADAPVPDARAVDAAAVDAAAADAPVGTPDARPADARPVDAGDPDASCAGPICGGVCCASDQVCNGADVCCKPIDCATAGAECGAPADGCDGFLACGGCPDADEACDAAYQCYCPGPVCGTDCCAAGDVCFEGACATPWTDLGMPDSAASSGVHGHALAANGGSPAVAYVLNSTGNRGLVVANHSGAAWITLFPSPADIATESPDAVALGHNGTNLVVAYSAGTNLRVKARSGITWSQIGPAATSACTMHWSVGMALDGANPHLVSYGSGGCGMGIDYTWWDGTNWRQHASPTTFAGQITMDGAGRPGIVYGSEAIVAVPYSTTVAPIATRHVATRWLGPSWSDYGAALDVNAATGWQEDMAIAMNGASFAAAWAEGDGGAPVVYKVYVKTRTLAADWTALGGEVSGAGSATAPSIAYVGGVPWVAYLEQFGGADVVRVKRWTGTVWANVGPPLNSVVACDADEPLIVDVAGTPHVAFREDDGTGLYHLRVKAAP